MLPQAVLGVKIMNTQFIVMLGTVFITVCIVKFASAWKELYSPWTNLNRRMYLWD